MSLINNIEYNKDILASYMAVYSADMYGTEIKDADGVQIYFELELTEISAYPGWLDTVVPSELNTFGYTWKDVVLARIGLLGFFGYHPEWYSDNSGVGTGIVQNNLVSGVLNTVKKSEMTAIIENMQSTLMGNTSLIDSISPDSAVYDNVFRFILGYRSYVGIEPLSVFLNSLSPDIYCDININNLMIRVVGQATYEPEVIAVESTLEITKDDVVIDAAPVVKYLNGTMYSNKASASDIDIPITINFDNIAAITTEGTTYDSRIGVAPALYYEFKMPLTKFIEIYKNGYDGEGGKNLSADPIPRFDFNFNPNGLDIATLNPVLHEAMNDWNKSFKMATVNICFDIPSTRLSVLDADMYTPISMNYIKNTDGSIKPLAVLGAYSLDGYWFYGTSYSSMYFSTDIGRGLNNDNIDAFINDNVNLITEADGSKSIVIYLCTTINKSSTDLGITYFPDSTLDMTCRISPYSFFTMPAATSENKLIETITLAENVDIGKVSVAMTVPDMSDSYRPNQVSKLNYILESSEDNVTWKVLSDVTKTGTSYMTSTVIDLNNYTVASTVLEGITLSKFSHRYIKIETEASGYCYERVNGVLNQTADKYLVLKALNILNGTTKLPYTILSAYTQAANVSVGGKAKTLTEVATALNVNFSDDDIKIISTGKVTMIIDLGATAVSFDEIKVVTGAKTSNGMNEFKYTISYSADLSSFTSSTTIDPNNTVTSGIFETTTF